MRRASRQRQKAPAESWGVEVDREARPGNVCKPLAALLLRLAAKELEKIQSEKARPRSNDTDKRTLDYGQQRDKKQG
jgi:hypothetical protein